MSKEVAELHLTKVYREIRTREVQDGWVQPHQLDRPYPYRIDAGIDLRLVFAEGGHWEGLVGTDDVRFIDHEEEGSVFVGIKGHLFPLAQNYRLVAGHKAV